MATWEVDVVAATNRGHLADQLNAMAKEGWEPILYQLFTEPPSGGQSNIKVSHYVIIRRPDPEAVYD